MSFGFGCSATAIVAWTVFLVGYFYASRGAWALSVTGNAIMFMALAQVITSAVVLTAPPSILRTFAGLVSLTSAVIFLLSLQRSEGE